MLKTALLHRKEPARQRRSDYKETGICRGELPPHPALRDHLLPEGEGLGSCAMAVATCIFYKALEFFAEAFLQKGRKTRD